MNPVDSAPSARAAIEAFAVSLCRSAGLLCAFSGPRFVLSADRARPGSRPCFLPIRLSLSLSLSFSRLKLFFSLSLNPLSPPPAVFYLVTFRFTCVREERFRAYEFSPFLRPYFSVYPTGNGFFICLVFQCIRKRRRPTYTIYART